MMLGILNFEVESRDLREQGFRPIDTDGDRDYAIFVCKH